MGYALITGASSGLGYEFAKKLDSMGYDTIIVARRLERLEELKNELKNKTVILSYDLSNIDDCKKLVEDIKDYDISIFINNAGFGDFNLFKDSDINKGINMIDLNVRALTFLMHEVLNIFVKNNKGTIINVSSIAGLLPGGPYMSVYYATKAYVTSLTRAVAYENKKYKNIYIKALCPGPVTTEFNDVANVKFSLKSITSTYCVDYTIKHMHKRKVIIAPSFGVRFVNKFARLFPINTLLKICYKSQRKKQNENK